MKLTSLIAAATVGAFALTACGSATTQTDAVQTAATVDDAVKSGTFAGRSQHETSGSVSITGTAGNYTLALGTDFELDGAPDPVVGFGNNGSYEATTQIGALTSNTGEQSYSLPADFDPENINEVYIWCEEFSVPLGVASLTAP